MVIAKTNLVKRSSEEELFPDMQIIIPVVAIIALILLYVTTSVSPHAVLLNEPRLTENIGTQLRAQGIWALLSLFVANFFWMPVDVSTWQRISSIKLPGSQNGNDHLSAIRKGIFRVMLESPASWGLGVVFGMALKYSGLVNFNEDSTLAISKFSEALVQMGFGGKGSFVCYLYPVFIVAMIAVMLSTVDELLSAITFTAYDDVIERKQCQMGQNNARSLNKARFVTAGICIMGAAIYYGFRFILKVEIATILYTFYSSQLALFPIVIASLMNRTRGGRAAIMSLVLGILAAFITAYSSAIGWTVKGLDLSLMPPLVCLLVASIVYRFWPKGAEKGE
jgi:hypothetical protein